MRTQSTPLPPLPLEIQAHVLRFYDVPTLAVTSRVSLAFLELSIPILHDDIHIDGLEQVETLFCTRASGPSALDGTLSLQQVRTMSITWTSPPPPNLSVTPICRDRLRGSTGTLSVVHLVLGAPRDSQDEPRWPPLLALLDPENVCVQAVPGQSQEEGDDLLYAFIDLRTAPWSRLGSIEFVSSTT